MDWEDWRLTLLENAVFFSICKHSDSATCVPADSGSKIVFVPALFPFENSRWPWSGVTPSTGGGRACHGTIIGTMLIRHW